MIKKAASAAAARAPARSEEEKKALDEALSAAAHEGDEDGARKLLDEGADPDYRTDDIFDFTTLIRAAKQDHAGMVKLLVEQGHAAVGGRCNSGWTASHWCASYGKLRALQELVRLGADPTKRTAEGWTAMDVARQKRKMEVVEYLERLKAA